MQDEKRKLMMQIRELSLENDKLKNQVDKLEEQLSGLQISLSIDEVIEAFREEKKETKTTFNPFALFQKKPDSSNSDEGGIIADMPDNNER